MNKKNPNLWFISEIIQAIILIMATIMMLWLYTPYNMLVKIIITIISLIIFYDMFRIFVVVKNLMLEANEDFFNIHKKR